MVFLIDAVLQSIVWREHRMLNLQNRCFGNKNCRIYFRAWVLWREPQTITAYSLWGKQGSENWEENDCAKTLKWVKFCWTEARCETSEYLKLSFDKNNFQGIQVVQTSCICISYLLLRSYLRILWSEFTFKTYETLFKEWRGKWCWKTTDHCGFMNNFGEVDGFQVCDVFLK